MEEDRYAPIYILTWNPHKFDWKEYRKCVEICKQAGKLYGGWTCRSKSPQSGNRFVLLMQGMRSDNGIVGAGIFVQEPENIGLETKYGTRYVYIRFGKLIDYTNDDYVKTSVLKEQFPEQCWIPQMSGTRIKSKYVPIVWDKVWQN